MVSGTLLESTVQLRCTPGQKLTRKFWREFKMADLLCGNIFFLISLFFRSYNFDRQRGQSLVDAAKSRLPELSMRTVFDVFIRLIKLIFGLLAQGAASASGGASKISFKVKGQVSRVLQGQVQEEGEGITITHTMGSLSTTV